MRESYLTIAWDEHEQEGDGDLRIGERNLRVRLRAPNPNVAHTDPQEWSYLYWHEGDRDSSQHGVVAPVTLDTLRLWMIWLHGGEKPESPPP